MNKYANIISMLKQLNNKLEDEGDNAHTAQNYSGIESDKRYYQDIKNKVDELQEIIEQQLKEMV